MKFAKWFKKLRTSRGLTQVETAKLLKLTSPTISRWEKGTAPRAEHLMRICQWAQISPDKLVGMLD